jgi:hypothetical protein
MVPDVSTGSDTRGLIVYLIAPSRNPCEGAHIERRYGQRVSRRGFCVRICPD